MLSSDGQSECFLIARDFKRAGGRNGKFVFCYVVGLSLDDTACPVVVLSPLRIGLRDVCRLILTTCRFGYVKIWLTCNCMELDYDQNLFTWMCFFSDCFNRIC